MLGVILHQGTLDEIDTWRGPGQTVVEHVSGNTTNTVIQAYQYAVAKMQGGPVAFGTDDNGFAGLPVRATDRTWMQAGTLEARPRAG